MDTITRAPDQPAEVRDRLAALLPAADEIFGGPGLLTIQMRYGDAATLADDLEQGRKDKAEVERLTAALADCVIKCTEYGTQDDGFVAFYITPTGPIHRAIPLLQEHGITVRPGFDGRAALDGQPEQERADG